MRRSSAMRASRWSTDMRHAAGAALLAAASCALAQDVAPVNDLPNPYATAPFGTLPEGRRWGAVSAVTVDNDGESVWVADRCGQNPEAPPGAPPFQFDSCAGSDLPPVLKFDASGRLVRSFGANLFI